MSNLAKALLEAMKKIGHLQTDKSVGSGNNSYKGITDQKATKNIRKVLIEVGVIALPVDIEASTSPYQYLTTNNYGKEVSKIHVFCEVKTAIELIHAESGESKVIKAIGHGIDNGDKAAGKAMTYAKKNALLNALLISTGNDADDIHSDDLPTPPVESNKGKGHDVANEQSIDPSVGSDEQVKLIAELLASSKFDAIRDKVITALNDGKKTASEAIEYLQTEIKKQ